MASRSIWGSLLGRRGSSNAEELPSDEDDLIISSNTGRRSASQVQTLGSMRTKPSSSNSNNNSMSSAHGAQNGSSHDPLMARPSSRPSSRSSHKKQQQQDFDAEQESKSIKNGNSSPAEPAETSKMQPSAAARTGSSNGSATGTSSRTTAAAPGLLTPEREHEQRPTSASASRAAHDSASSALDSRDSGGHLAGAFRAPSPAAPKSTAAEEQQQQQEPAGPIAADVTALFSTEDLPSATSIVTTPSEPPTAGGSSSEQQQQQQPAAGLPNYIYTSPRMADGSTTSSSTSSSPPQQHQQQPGSSSDSSIGPGPEAVLGSAGATTEFSGELNPDGFGGLPGLSGPFPQDHQAAQAQPGAGGRLPNAGASLQLQDLLSELQNQAGLSADQAAAAAALMQRFAGPPPTNSFQPQAPSAHPWAQNPPLGLNTPPSAQNPAAGLAGLNPMGMGGPGAQNPVLGPQFFQTPGAGGGPGLLGGGGGSGAFGSGAFGGAASALTAPLMSFESVNSSGSNVVGQMEPGSAGVSASGFASVGLNGLLGPQSGGLVGNPEAAFAHDGLDTPGTAQVAVHNVPFKWCNSDLESLFRDQEGFLDAQLLFHENGRSKGVGVALFRDRGCATDVCQKLSGAQADGRKLELVLMNPDNHISFSCKQVAVLGLPWEYTAADVRALIEAAAEADGAPAADAGVEAVEVAYREDGKSEGRAIATFRSRCQARDAITRLHGRETLAGLRMRLFYLHEQQRQHVLAHQAPWLAPLMGSLGLAGDISGLSLGPGVPPTALGTNNSGNVARQLMLPPNSAAAAAGGGGGGSAAAGAGGNGSGVLGGAGEGGSAGGAGGGGDIESQGPGRSSGEGPAPSSAAGEASGASGLGDESGSARSSFEKDQGPVILHVSGLMESVTREQLRELFSQAGEVTKVDIPDGGRSMGYGFITFSNPQAAEQAMLLFNNYPLGGGAIHVAYSTSATAKARQQALRQARKATLGWHAGSARVSSDGGGMKPSTPRGPGPAGSNTFSSSNSRRMHNASSFSNTPLGGPGGPAGSLGSLDALQGVPPIRHSFDHPGYTSPLNRGWPGATGPGGMGPGLSSSLGALGGTPPGMMPVPGAAGLGHGRARRNSYGQGLPSSQLQMLQGAAAAPAGPFDVSTAGNIEQQLQLLMQLSGTDGSFPGGAAGPPGFGGPGGVPGPLAGPASGPPGTPPPAGSFRGAMGPSPAAGLFSTPPGPAARLAGGPGGGGGFGPAGLGAQGGAGAAGLSTPPHAGAAGAGSAFGGLFGTTSEPLMSANLPGTPGAAALFSPGLSGFGDLTMPPGFDGGAGMGLSGFLSGGAAGSAAAAAAAQQQQQQQAARRQVLVTGLPPGLREPDLRTLFEICGPLRGVSKLPEQDFAIITYDNPECARKAVAMLDGTKLPSGSTLSLQFTSLLPETPARPTEGPWPPAPGGTPLGPFGASTGFAATPGTLGGGSLTPPRGSYTGDAAAAAAGGLNSGSLFPATEGGLGSGFNSAGSDLFGPTLGTTAGFAGYGGGASWDGGASVPAGAAPAGGFRSLSPSFGLPPRDGGSGFGGNAASSGWSSNAALAASGLYAPSSLRASSPGPGAASSSPAVPRSSLAAQNALPPIYTASPVPAGKGSHSQLAGLDGSLGMAGFGQQGAQRGGRGMSSSSSSDGEDGHANLAGNAGGEVEEFGRRRRAGMPATGSVGNASQGSARGSDGGMA